MIDSHSHLDFFHPVIQTTLWARAKSYGLKNSLICAVFRDNFLAVKDCCQRLNLMAAYGFHPLYLDKYQRGDFEFLKEFIKHNPTVAIGECGLDYLCNIDKNFQKEIFIKHLELAEQLNLPLSIHARKALDEVLHLIKPFKVKFIIHSFTGSNQQLENIFKLGGIIGIGGTSTYPRAKRLQSQLKIIPKNSFLLETDCPDQPICGFQGIKNEPAKTFWVAKNLAELRNCTIKEIIEDCRETAKIFRQ